MINYDVPSLQPHFPAYPVFFFIAKAIYLSIDSYALSFSLVGGLSTWLIIYLTMALARINITTLLGLTIAFLLFMNPLLWLMGNRYMPDVMGVAFAIGVLWLTAQQNENRVLLGFALAGLSLGVRLSYAPLLLPALLCRWLHKGSRLRFALSGAIGVAAWLIPLAAVTGFKEIIAAATAQGHGHFVNFGGTVFTEPNVFERVVRLMESLWADSFGLYWPGRHWLTAITALTLFGILVGGRSTLLKNLDHKLLFGTPAFGCLLYLAWIFFFQNIVHKSRHVLPLLPFLTLIIAVAASHLITHRSLILKIVLVAFAATYAYVTLHLVIQHKKPSAVAQVYDHLKSREGDGLHVVSTPLMKYYLASQGLDASYTVVRNKDDLEANANVVDPMGLFSVGSPLPNRTAKSTFEFYHNPYVNRMWPNLFVYEY